MNTKQDVTIDIFGKRYTISCPADKIDELKEACRIVNREIDKVYEKSKIFDIEKLTTIAALNIAHLLIFNQKQKETEINWQQSIINTKKRMAQLLCEE